jgi:hypothetical protein
MGMQIKERIDTCLSALEHKRQTVTVFQAKLRQLIDVLKTEGMTPGTLAELLKTLESVLQDYSEIGANCQQMVEGLRQIGDHLIHIEDGRHKILEGVEAILKNLTHLDQLAKSGLQVGATTGKSPKRILLVRIVPGNKPVPRRDEEEDEEGPGEETTVH